MPTADLADDIAKPFTRIPALSMGTDSATSPWMDTRTAMGPAPGESSRQRLALMRLAGLGCWLTLAAGCITLGPRLDSSPVKATPTDVPGQYQIWCPDVLDVQVEGRPELCGSRPVGIDGRIPFDADSRLRVEGLTVPQVSRLLAAEAGVLPARVHVRVAEFNSQQIYLFGQVNGLQRTLAYQGPETVIDALKRAGGLTTGASLTHVDLIRSHITEGKQPELYHVEVSAILKKHDQRSNVRLLPFDEIYVGETRQSVLLRCISPCFKPLFNAWCRFCPFMEPASPGPTTAPVQSTTSPVANRD